MKKFLVIILSIMFVASFSSLAQANEMMDRVGHGLEKVVKSPVHFFTSPRDGMDMADNKVVGFTKGLVKSPFMFLEDLGDGLFEVVTFPIVNSPVASDAMSVGDKFEEGFSNIFKSPKHTIDHMKHIGTHHDPKFISYPRAVLESPAALVDSLGHGLVDILTFPVHK